MSVHSLISIFLLLLLAYLLPGLCRARDDDDEQYTLCSQPYQCGNLSGLGYPFWGDYRPWYCGRRDFSLTCKENQSIIDINSTSYFVLDVSPPNKLTVSRFDLWDNFCFSQVQDSLFPFFNMFLPHFSFDGADGKLQIFHGCSFKNKSSYPVGLVSTNIKCSIPPGGATYNIFYSFGNPSHVDECINSTKVHVHISAYYQLSNKSITLQEAVNQGFDIMYGGASQDECEVCNASGGRCGSDAHDNFICLCPDQPYLKACPAQSRRLNFRQKIGVGFGAAALTVLIMYLVFFIYRTESFGASLQMLRRKTKEDRNLEAFIKQYGSLAPKRYSYRDIKKMTKSFKGELGRGGYGTVYKGKLSGGRLVAVKILNVAKSNGQEFINEVLSISRTSHVNVVTLLGFCLDGQKRALVYEYMRNGSLEKYIHRNKNSMSCNQLAINELYRIALGVARGLEYLHLGCNTRILHFDIKPHNILLDRNFCPKISDFGLAKQCTADETTVSILGARGTIGYIAPELVCRSFGGVSYKSDVYSYGMLILEIVGCRKNVSLETSHTSEVYFPYWAYQHLVVHKDLRLKGVVSPEEDEIARKIIMVGLWCIQNDPSQRPTMSKVIEMLEGNSDAIAIPPKAFFGSPSTTPQPSDGSSFSWNICHLNMLISIPFTVH